MQSTLGVPFKLFSYFMILSKEYISLRSLDQRTDHFSLDMKHHVYQVILSLVNCQN